MPYFIATETGPQEMHDDEFICINPLPVQFVVLNGSIMSMSDFEWMPRYGIQVPTKHVGAIMWIERREDGQL